ncbi:hypothetical protein [Mycobacteroides abscessus]|uniref:TPR repeat region-containing protein n=1 Tax=Mycobacteroides abscessus TaxID=36809 RepID=UPI000D9CD191|nr:hypothetical protein [Mycobacteroides abscessus]SPX71371.1 Uncharacterised protein [Mycobacteroides abscessus]
MFTRPDVEAWRLSVLTDWAGTLKAGNETVVRELDTMTRYFEDVRDDWQGVGFEAAREHAGTEHSSGIKVSTEVDSLHDAVTQGAGMLGSRRDVLLNKVADAEHDGYTVSADWKVAKTVPAGATQQQATDIANAVKGHQDAINAALAALKDEADTTARAIDDAAQRIRVRGDEAGDGDLAALDKPAEDDAQRIGEEDGKALADEAAKPADQRDNSVFARIGSQLPTHLLTDAELKELAAGREVATVPAAVQEYYRDLYRTAGKDGVLALGEYLKGQEAAGNPTAGLQRDALANGLTVVSNEKVGTGKDANGKLVNAGGYQYVPKSLQDLIAQRPGDGTMYPEYLAPPQTGPVGLPHSDRFPAPMPADGPYPGLPNPMKENYIGELGQFQSLMSEANPGYTPGTEMGTKLYEKAADMAAHPDLTNTSVNGKDFDKVAGGLAEFGGRNHEAAYRIWSGDGMPPDYHKDSTVRALLGHNWSGSDGGSGAASLLNWIGDDAKLPNDTPMGQHARSALADMPRMLGSDRYHPDPETWKHTQDAFMHSPKLSDAMSNVLASNMDAINGDRTAGWSGESQVAQDGRPTLNVTDAQRMMELGSYTQEGRTNLVTGAELQRQQILSGEFRQNPDGPLSGLPSQTSGDFSGRLESAMRDAITHQNEAGAAEAKNPTDEVNQAKLFGAKLAGEIADKAIDKGIGSLPGGEAASIVFDATGMKPGDWVQERMQQLLGMPEFQPTALDDPAQLRARASDAIANNVLRSAYAAGVPIPPDLLDGHGQPIDMAEKQALSRQVTEAWGKFQSGHGITQYIIDYQQSYDGGRSVEGPPHD